MLTLNFDVNISQEACGLIGQIFYHIPQDLAPMRFRFSNPDKELPYIMTGNPSLHKKGLLHYNNGTIFSGRTINTVKLKEIIEKSPVTISVSMFDGVYLIGKYFFAKVLNRSIGMIDPEDRIEILFTTTAEVGKPLTSPHDLKIYLHRELYEPRYKRLMSILKPYMAEHQGDILVTRSINNLLLYQFKLPVFPNLTSRAEFDLDMKELFFRSIKWTVWRNREDIRIAEEEQIRAAALAREQKAMGEQQSILNVIFAEEARMAALQLEATVQPELVDFQAGGVETSMEDTSNTEMNQPLHSSITPLQSTLSPVGQTLEQEQVPISIPLPTPEISTSLMETLVQRASQLEQLHQQINSTLSVPEEVEPSQPVELQDTQDMEAQQDSQPVQTNVEGVEHVSEDEMLRIMARFAINPSANVEYVVGLDPISGMERPSGHVTIGRIVESSDEEPVAEYHSRPDEVDEDTEIVISIDGQQWEEEDFDDDGGPMTREQAEEALDNDPDAYEDAEIVEVPTASELNQMMIEGVGRAAREGRL